MHIKIFTARQGYSSIETRATVVFVSKRIVPHVVRTSRYLNQENIQAPTVCIYVGACITILFVHSYKSTITLLRFNLPNAVSEDVVPQT